METTLASSPALPPEIWQQVFLYNSDPQHLWLSGRSVCRFWRQSIPAVFYNKYLKDPTFTSIFFDCGQNLRSGGTLFSQSMIMDFSALDPEDPSRCIFAECPETSLQSCPEVIAPPGRNAVYQSLKYIEWFMLMQNYLGDRSNTSKSFSDRHGRPDLTPHVIRIRNMVNDTELPGLICQFDKREISFEWIPMFQKFFREQQAVQDLMSRRWERTPSPAGRSVNPHSSSLIDDIHDDALGLYNNLDSSIRQNVRRTRIKHWYQSRGLEYFWPEARDAKEEERVRLDRIESQAIIASQMCFDDNTEMDAFTDEDDPEDHQDQEAS